MALFLCILFNKLAAFVSYILEGSRFWFCLVKMLFHLASIYLLIVKNQSVFSI